MENNKDSTERHMDVCDFKKTFQRLLYFTSFGSMRVVIFPFARLAEGASGDLMGQQGAVTRRQDTHIWLQPDAFLADKSELF